MRTHAMWAKMPAMKPTAPSRTCTHMNRLTGWFRSDWNPQAELAYIVLLYLAMWAAVHSSPLRSQARRTDTCNAHEAV